MSVSKKPPQPRGWAILGYQRPYGQEITVTLYGCQECGSAVWDRQRHEAVCPTTDEKRPSVACACGHAAAHHDKRKSVYGGLMADYRVVWACGWTGCDCPRFVTCDTSTSAGSQEQP